MPNADYDILVEAAKHRYFDAIALVAASLARYRPFDPAVAYTPEERERWDALCDRYLRAMEMAIR